MLSLRAASSWLPSSHCRRHTFDSAVLALSCASAVIALCRRDDEAFVERPDHTLAIQCSRVSGWPKSLINKFELSPRSSVGIARPTSIGTHARASNVAGM